MSLADLLPDATELIAAEMKRLSGAGASITCELLPNEALAIIAATQRFYLDYDMPPNMRGDTYRGSTRLVHAFQPHSPAFAQVATQYWVRHLARRRDVLGAREMGAVQDVLFIRTFEPLSLITIEGVAAIHTNGELGEATSTISFERPLTYKERDWRYERLVYTFADRQIVLHAWIDMYISSDQMMVMFSPIALQLPVPYQGLPRQPMTPWD